MAIEWQRLPVWRSPRDAWLIMHDTKMFLFTHRYGFQPGLGFFFFPSSGNLIHWTGVDWGDSHGSRGLVWEPTTASGSRGISTAGDRGGAGASYSSCYTCVVLTRKHNLAPQFHSFSSIRLDWNFLAHFPGAVKWAVSHVSEPAPLLIRSNTSRSLLYGSVWAGLSTQTPPPGCGVIDNISPAPHTRAHLYSWLEKGPRCPLTSAVPVIGWWGNMTSASETRGRSLWYMPGNGRLFIHKVQCDSRWQITRAARRCL